jgi:hypothetical protein
MVPGRENLKNKQFHLHFSIHKLNSAENNNKQNVGCRKTSKLTRSDFSLSRDLLHEYLHRRKAESLLFKLLFIKEIVVSTDNCVASQQPCASKVYFPGSSAVTKL